MSYKLDKKTGDISITGFEYGVADSPYQGISDIRNINLISIPEEASVNFATALNSNPTVSSGTVVSADAATETIVISGASGFVSNNAVVFSGGSLPGGIVAGTVYWLVQAGVNTYTLSAVYNLATTVNITSTGTGTFTVYNMAQPKYFAVDMVNRYWMIDTNGFVWANDGTGQGWRFTGNTGGTGKSGNGLVFYQGSDGAGWIFAFSNHQIDYIKLDATTGTLNTWQYNWKTMNTAVGVSNSHEAAVGPDNKVYFCDAAYIGRFYQTSRGNPFDPTNSGTYLYDTTAVLPFTDIGNCLTFSGNNVLVGGQKNIIYPWDTFSQLPNFPIFVAENNIIKMVTVNTNVFALVGSRGRVYVYNGSQAQLFKKIPDHISRTVEPYFTWGGLTSIKNQLYFSALVTTNGGVANNNYGGVWAIDLDTKALRLTNKLSYGTYAGYATALTPNFATNPAGTGLYIGWDNGSSVYGIDITVGTPYTGGEATIDSDLIPIGTFLKPTTSGRVEFKLAVPLVAGESVQLFYRQRFSDSFTAVGSAVTINTQGFSGYSWAYTSVNFQSSQWIQIRAVSTSTASSPSYVRLTEIILGN